MRGMNEDVESMERGRGAVVCELQDKMYLHDIVRYIVGSGWTQ